MLVVRKIGVYLWSAWCLIVIALIVLLMMPLLYLVVLINYPPLLRWAHLVPPFLSRVALFLFGVRVEIRNKDLMDVNGQFIFISNHRSYLDAFIAGAVIRNYLKFLGKGEILNYPGFGYLLEKFYVPVWRKDQAHRAWSMEAMEEKVKMGYSFFICPEGTCNVTSDLLLHFYDGAFKLSIETGIAIVPLTFVGSGELMPRSNLLLRPGKIIVYYHAPISAGEFHLETLEAYKEKVKTIILRDLQRHYPNGYPL